MTTAALAPTPATFATKAARLAWYKEQIASRPQWAIRAMLRIYAYQTAAEKSVESTQEDNGVGFGGRDGFILSRFSKQVLAWEAETVHKYPNPLSPKQTALVLKLMPKYTAQLLAHLETTGKAIPVVKSSKETA